jgi:cation diffusion facilitator family transporter
MSSEGGTKAVIAAMIANGGIALSKLVAWAVTGSSSMLSEAIHSVADTANQALLLIGGKRSLRAPDELHQFGYGRTRFVYAFMVSIILFLLGGVFSLYEGFHKIQHPEELRSVGVAYAVLLIAVGLEAWSWRTAMREAKKSRGTVPLSQYLRRSRQPELPVVLLEDTGALVGLLFALTGITLAVVTGEPRWDGMGAMAVGVLLLVIAVFLAFEMASMLIGESALPEQEEAIRGAVAATPGIHGVIGMRTIHTGPDTLLVAVKVRAEGSGSAEDLAAAINEAELKIRAAVPEAKYVYIEPDIYREDYESPEHGAGPLPGR